MNFGSVNRLMNRKGYVLIEAIVAGTLLSMVAAGMTAGIMQGIRVERNIRASYAAEAPFKLMSMHADRDLRNMVVLRDYRFKGKSNAMEFPVWNTQGKLEVVRYFVRDKSLWRSVESLPKKFVAEAPVERVSLKNLERVELGYAYLDEEDALYFGEEWQEEPYLGIPMAVRIKVKFVGDEKLYVKTVAIPQGRWGHEAQE